MSSNGSNGAIGGGGFHHVAIKSSDFEATLKFYTEGLGFKPRYTWGVDGRSASEADSRAVLLDTGDGNYLEVFAGGKKRALDAGDEGPILHFALRTTDAGAALERARAAGGVVTTETKSLIPPHAQEPGLTFRIAFVRGPDGEMIEFFQNDEL